MKFSSTDVEKMAQLAKLNVDQKQGESLAKGFSQSLSEVEKLTKIDTKKVKPTYQVNNLLNITRPDEIDEKNQLSQKEALANAPFSHQGYFVVKRILDHET